MAFPGWVATLPVDILPNSGAIYLGAPGSQILLGRTMGGINWDPGRGVDEIKFDGKRAGVRGMDWITDYKSVIKTKMLSYSAAVFTQLEPGIISASGSGSVLTYWTAATASTPFGVGSYLQDLSAVWRRADLSFFRVRLHWALVTKYTVNAKDKAPAEIDCEFEGRVDPTTINPATGALYTTDDAPYILEAIQAGGTL